MTIKPDYGLHLTRSGYDATMQIDFANWMVWDITVLAPGRYSTFGEVDCEDERHAVSLDFDADLLSQMLARAPSGVRDWVERQIREDPISPRSIDLPEPIQCGMSARLGEEQRGQFESFVPFIIESVY